MAESRPSWAEWRAADRAQQEKRRAVHAELRAHLLETVGPEPWPVRLVARRNSRADGAYVWVASPPIMVIYGLVALGFAGILGSGLIPTEMPVELQWVVTGPIFVVGLAILVRGFVRLRWWLRARAAALTWTRSHGDIMPVDLRW